MTLTRCAPFHGVLQGGNPIVWGDNRGVHWIAYGQANRFLQTGNVKQVKFHAVNTNLVIEFRIEIWTETATDGLFDLKSTSSNFASQLVTGLNVLDMSASPIAVAEGDYYGIYIKLNTATGTGIIDSYSTASEYEGNHRCVYDITSTNFNWGTATADLGTMNIEFLMDAPDIVFTGDSIISGQALSFACTNQGFYAPASDFSKAIPAKFQALSGLKSQNVATSGINYPRIYNEFKSWALARSPKYILIEGGINNLKAGHTAATIFAYIQQQILDCQAAGIMPIVCLVFPTTGQLTTAQKAEYNTLNQSIIDYHTTNPNFILVDCREALGTLSGGNWTLDNTYSSDGLHLNEAGNTLVAQTIWNAFSAPTANFTTVYDHAFRNIIHFTDTTTGNPTSWSWNFGDGDTSTERNPVHTYKTTGNYQVTLTVTGLGGSSYSIQNIVALGQVVSFANIPINTYQVVKSGYQIDSTVTVLQSGKLFTEISPNTRKFPRLFECYAGSLAEIETIAGKIGTFANLNVNGVVYQKCWISGLDNIHEIWENTDHYTYSIQFSQTDVY
jgi:lysophospholipase L1-like esterase